MTFLDRICGLYRADHYCTKHEEIQPQFALWQKLLACFFTFSFWAIIFLGFFFTRATPQNFSCWAVVFALTFVINIYLPVQKVFPRLFRTRNYCFYSAINSFWKYLIYVAVRFVYAAAVLIFLRYIYFGIDNNYYILPNDQEIKEVEFVSWLPSEAMVYDHSNFSWPCKFITTDKIIVNCRFFINEQSKLDKVKLLAQDSENYGRSLNPKVFDSLSFENSNGYILIKEEDPSLNLLDLSPNEMQKVLAKRVNDFLQKQGLLLQEFKVTEIYIE